MEYYRLNPCPFCKFESNLRFNESFWVACNDCGAQGPYKETPQDAIESWNTPQAGWIPFNSELNPEIGVPILVTNKKMVGEIILKELTPQSIGDLTHWMLLPTIPN